jgi:hypothetical protein
MVGNVPERTAIWWLFVLVDMVSRLGSGLPVLYVVGYAIYAALTGQPFGCD